MPSLRENRFFSDPPYIALLLLGLLTLFRLAYANSLDLIPDESYYWLWSKHLDASYFSKGPAIAWTIAAGTLAGGDTVLGVRWLSVVLSAATGWQLFLLGRRLGGPWVGLSALVIAVVVPLDAVGAILMTIDPISVFFWVWAANLFLNALEKEYPGRWALAGAAVGLGFLGKYINLLQIVGFAAFLALIPRHRRFLCSRQSAAFLGAVLLCMLPVLWWNQHHDWVTATHLQHRGDLDGGFHLHPGELLHFVFMQALVISPLLWLALMIAAWKTLRRPDKSEAQLYLLCLFLPCFVFYALLSLNKAAEGNWTAVSYPAAFILAALYWSPRAAWQRSARWFWHGALALALIQTVLLHHSAWLPLPPGKDIMLRARGWRQYGMQFQTLRQEAQEAAGFDAPPFLIIADGYGTASELAFYLPDHPPVFLPRTDHVENQFSIWPGYAVKKGTSALYLTDDPDPHPPAVLTQDFGKAVRWGNFYRQADGVKINRYYVWKLGPAP